MFSVFGVLVVVPGSRARLLSRPVDRDGGMNGANCFTVLPSQIMIYSLELAHMYFTDNYSFDLFGCV